MKNTSPYKTRSGQEPGLVSLEPLMPSLSACWTIGAFGRQRLYILSGRFGPDNSFCSRYVVFPEVLAGLPPVARDRPEAHRDQAHGCRWLIRSLIGKQDYTKGRLDILQTWLAETPDADGHLEHSVTLGIADDAQEAQQECVKHAVAAGNGRVSVVEAVSEEAPVPLAEVSKEMSEELVAR